MYAHALDITAFILLITVRFMTTGSSILPRVNREPGKEARGVLWQLL